jgi:nicotinamidase/pyrazinamidase
MTKALIIVDFQRDFCKGGSLANDEADTIIPKVNEYISQYMDKGLPIIYTFDWHPEETPHFEKWPVHCVQGTDGAMLHPGIIYPDNYTPMGVVWKGLGQDDGYSGFSEPAKAIAFVEDETRPCLSMETLLTFLGVTDILVVGLLLDYCVGETALDAIDHGYKVRITANGTVFHSSETAITMCDRLEAAGVALADLTPTE